MTALISDQDLSLTAKERRQTCAAGRVSAQVTVGPWGGRKLHKFLSFHKENNGSFNTSTSSFRISPIERDCLPTLLIPGL